MRYPIFTPVLALTLMPLSAASPVQFCNSAITADAPKSRYTTYTNGTVLDKQTGLVWKRCAEGQAWQAGACTGSAATFRWQQALAAAEQAGFAGKTDWRLPNQKELLSLVEHRCSSPAINLAVFPNAPFGWFWSSSSYADDSSDAWIVDFFGSGIYDYKDNFNVVRLVRAGQ